MVRLFLCYNINIMKPKTKKLTDKQKKVIDTAVKKVVKDYNKTLKKLALT